MKQKSAFLLVLYMVFATFQAFGSTCAYESVEQKSCCVSTDCCAKSQCCVGEEENNQQPTEVLLNSRINLHFNVLFLSEIDFFEIAFQPEIITVFALPTNRPPPKQPFYISFHKLILYA